MLSRRYFLRSSALAIAGLGIAPSWLVRASAQGAKQQKQDPDYHLLQRGAADGLNIVVPHFEKRYYEMRPTIAVPQPGKPNGAIDLDGRFGLHPSLQPLKALWDNKRNSRSSKPGYRGSQSAARLRGPGFHGVRARREAVLTEDGLDESCAAVQFRIPRRCALHRHGGGRLPLTLRGASQRCRRQRPATVSGEESGFVRHSRKHVRFDVGLAAGGSRQGNLRRRQNDRLD